MTHPNRKQHRFALLVIMLCAFALRVYHIDHFSFWLDEGLTPLRSGYSIRDILSGTIKIQEAVTEDTHPPLYYLLIHGTRVLFGQSDLAFRYPSALFSILLVPLMWHFGRKLLNPQIGLLAAALVAINPQQVWYAQEARMYPQLVLLLSAASYVLWLAWAERDKPLPRALALYTLFAGLAAFTHYTALFVILAQGLVWLLLLWRAGQRKLIGVAVLAGAVGASPFVPFVLRRARSGPEANYTLVQPQVILADVVRGFGFGRTVAYDTPLMLALLLSITALFFYGIWKAPAAQRNFLLVYLLAAPLGLIAGSYLIKPMYLGPHHIMAGSPAFFLLLAIGIAQMPLARIGPLLALLLVALAQGLSLSNLYNDPSYAKDDYRELVAYVETHAGDNDLVLYNNAILLPLHDHYRRRPSLEYTANPVYPYPVGDPNSPPVADVLAGYDRVWYMPANPSDGSDSIGFVEAAVELAGDRFVTQPFHGRSAIVAIWGYALGGTLTELPANAVPLENEPQAILVEPVQQRTLWVNLFWSTERADGREVTVQLRDPSGGVWANVNTILPQASEGAAIVKSTHELFLPLGLPPATYQVWLDDGGWWQVQSVVVDVTVMAQQADAAGVDAFENGIALADVAFLDETTFPGNPLPGFVRWQITEVDALAHSRYEVSVVGDDGELRRDGGPLVAEWVDVQKVRAGDVIAQPFAVYPRPDTEAGRYTLYWTVLDGEQSAASDVVDVQLGELEVLAWPLKTSVPVDNLVDSGDNRFGEAISLEGFTISAETARPNDAVAIDLYWRALSQPPANWQVFIHLVVAAGEQPLTQANGTPVGGIRPTRGWRPDEVLTDSYQLTLPADIAPGQYQLFVGLFDGDTFVRNPVTLEGVPQPFDQLPLTTITVPSE